MIVQAENGRLTVAAPAKVNLHLEVLTKRPDGFHEIETLMVAVTLFDRLSLEQTKQGTELVCQDADAGPPDKNLVMRAADLMRQESGRTDGLRIELTKSIPIAAGLAGGSSDAAATLAGLNQFWNLNWSADRLSELAAKLGSDIPFFFHLPAATAKGRGEKLESVPLGTGLDFVILAPHEGLSTKEVYGKVVPADRSSNGPVAMEPITQALKSGDKKRIASLLFNRLMEPSIELSEAVRTIRRDAESWPCLGHLMSGSGSAYFALCESAQQAESLGDSLREKNLGRVFVVRTCDPNDVAA